MYCMNCGAEIEDGYKFCMECGAAIDYEETTEYQHTPYYSRSSHIPHYNQDQSTSFSLLKLVGIIGGVLFAVILLLIMRRLRMVVLEILVSHFLILL